MRIIFAAHREICRRYGTLVLDEVQTGLYRSGRFLASYRYGADPDIVILAKALSGGLSPVGPCRGRPRFTWSTPLKRASAYVHLWRNSRLPCAPVITLTY
jgi:acetylornithine/succinyldiaminopimelate/putrescine aminotransferase